VLPIVVSLVVPSVVIVETIALVVTGEEVAPEPEPPEPLVPVAVAAVFVAGEVPDPPAPPVPAAPQYDEA